MPVIYLQLFENFLASFDGSCFSVSLLSIISLSSLVSAKEHKVWKQIFLPVIFGNIKTSIPVLVITKLNNNILLGRNWLNANKVHI